MSNKLSHFTQEGRPQMVDVGRKDETERVAIAKGSVKMAPETLAHITDKNMKKGDVLSVAQLAGIMGAKHTATLIPLCHPLALSHVNVIIHVNNDSYALDINAECKITGKTGVEMEALTAVSVAALTIYDMCKAIDKNMVIADIRLTHKSGGKSGRFDAE
ncbi:cyclic pyranopterin monophosphate synthase MoaC [Alphaproteobacteria bacterium]|nr:cyclic pyranopterin monophosphate synthase MoaC [Alphaproteobacteria bacterium]